MMDDLHLKLSSDFVTVADLCNDGTDIIRHDLYSVNGRLIGLGGVVSTATGFRNGRRRYQCRGDQQY